MVSNVKATMTTTLTTLAHAQLTGCIWRIMALAACPDLRPDCWLKHTSTWMPEAACTNLTMGTLAFLMTDTSRT